MWEIIIYVSNIKKVVKHFPFTNHVLEFDFPMNLHQNEI
jgi:hypothetical protein